jgi:hypothetical protein
MREFFVTHGRINGTNPHSKKKSLSVTIGRNSARPVTRYSDKNSYQVLLNVKVQEAIPLDSTHP